MNYTSAETLVGQTVSTFEGISANRNACYSYRTDTAGYFYGEYTTSEERNLNRIGQLDLYPANASGTYRTENVDYGTYRYAFKIYQKPAFFMQTLAAASGGIVSKTSFLLIGVAPYLAEAKARIIAVKECTHHPHYPESYYYLATKINS